MKHTSLPIPFFCLLAFSAFGFSDSPPVSPQTESVEPRVGKPGTVIKIKGKALDKGHVDEVYLTDHRFDMKVKILEQGDNHLTIRVPPFVKPGRLQLLLLTAGSQPAYLEQPWFVQIESADEETPVVEISHSAKSKPTVEVASNGSAVQVPLGGTPPTSPAATRELEKSVVPLKPSPQPVPPPRPPAEQTSIAQTTIAQTPIVQTPVVQTQPVQKPVTQTPPPALPDPAPQQATSIPKSINEAPPAAAAASDPGNIPAQLMQKTRVMYPPAAQAQRIEGAVELVAVVGQDGHVKAVKVTKGNPYLAAAALASVREWVYEPAYLHGKPVQSEVSIVLNFKRPL